jgi:hypothetical protein
MKLANKTIEIVASLKYLETVLKIKVRCKKKVRASEI